MFANHDANQPLRLYVDGLAEELMSVLDSVVRIGRGGNLEVNRVNFTVAIGLARDEHFNCKWNIAGSV